MLAPSDCIPGRSGRPYNSQGIIPEPKLELLELVDGSLAEVAIGVLLACGLCCSLGNGLVGRISMAFDNFLQAAIEGNPLGRLSA
jgi:hypothetical protein